MIPRQDVIWLDIAEPIEVLWQRAKESGRARFLVAREVRQPARNDHARRP